MFHYNLFETPKILTKTYIQNVGRILKEVIKKPQKGVINIVAVTPEDIAFLNAAYRGKEGATDILTFPYLESAQTAEDVAGEIYLCPEKIEMYARERGVTYEEQLRYIIIHGLVHMMGYDHGTEKESKEMEKIEKKISACIRAEK